MKIITLTAEQFDIYSSKHKYRNYYQTSNYAKLMVQFGFNAHFLGFANDDNNVIGATLILYKNVFMNNKIAYAPRGMLVDYDDPITLREITDRLKKLLGKQGFMSLKIDPFITSNIKDSEGHIMNINNQANIYIQNLIAAGFIKNPIDLNLTNEKPLFESVLLFNKNLDEIFNSFHKKTLDQIKKSTDYGLIITKSENNNINELYKFISTYDSKPKEYYSNLLKKFEDKLEVYYCKLDTEIFVINAKKLYEDEVENNSNLSIKIQEAANSQGGDPELIQLKMESDTKLNEFKNSLIYATKILKEQPDGLLIGGIITLNYDNSTFLIAEGYDKEYSNLYPDDFMKWQLIKLYSHQKKKFFNMGGVSGNFDDYKGQHLQKDTTLLGYNPVIMEYIGDFDIVLNQFIYNLYTNLNKDKK